MSASFETAGTFAHDNLYAGDHPVIVGKVTVLNGQNLARGAVVALDAASKAVLVDSTAGDTGDPRRTAYGIVANAVHADGADADGLVYLAGHFNELALEFGGSDDADDHRAALRTLGIFLSKNQGA